MDHYMDSEEQRSAAIGLWGGNMPNGRCLFFAWSPGSTRHCHQPPGVIFGSYSCEMKVTAFIAVSIFISLLSYNAYRKKNVEFPLPQYICFVFHLFT